MSDGIPHGTLGGYTGKHRCRCDPCREAYREYKRANADRIKARMAQYYIDNRERIIQRNLAYYYANREREIARATERNKANRQACRDAMKRWRQRNPEYSWRASNRERDLENGRRHRQTQKAKATQRAWTLANKDRRAIYSATWAKKHPARVMVRNFRNRMIREQAEIKVVTDRDWRRLCERHGNRCFYCQAKAPLTQDHVVPLSRGGRHSIGNLLPACQSCNSSKCARFIVEWRRVMFRAA